ncbi:cytochrome P450 [Kitasatospora sp. NPDC101157]|uniref:cytochrome P450 n=1 Tax=Kitasatospora sp. NPDC101157 TaxID=3364098 RepID=UPI0037FFD3C8
MRTGHPADPAAIALDTVDLADPELYASGDPHTVWHAMRERAPVHRQTLPDGRSFWSVTTYRDVNDVLRDHTRYTSERGTLLSVLGSADPAGGLMMAASDPPAHTALREPLSKAMSARALARWRPRIRDLVLRLLAPLADGPLDLAEAAASFPMAFTGALMGLPEADWARLARLTTMAVAPQDPAFQEGGGHTTLLSAHHELFRYFAQRVREVSADPGDDLTGFLVRMRANGRPLRQDELVYNCYSLLLGANVTTPHALAGTVLALMENPDQYRRLLAEPQLVPSAVEEGLRWSSPANHFLRHTVRDTEQHGVRIPRGDAVVAWLGSANRDASVFPDPYRFAVDRTPNRHVAFGFGPHYCVGAPLARIALGIMLEEIVRHVAEFRPAGPVRHLGSNFVAGISSLPVTAVLRDGMRDALAAHGPLPRPEVLA